MESKEESVIDDIIRSSNPLFFSNLAKLLKISAPIQIEEKRRLLKKIAGRFHHKGE